MIKKLISLALVISVSLSLSSNAKPSLNHDLKIYHCDFHVATYYPKRAEDSQVYSGNLIINDILGEQEFYPTATYLNLSPSSKYDYEARISFYKFSQNDEVSGTMMINKKGDSSNDHVSFAIIEDKSPKEISYFDDRKEYILKCYYRPYIVHE